MSGNMHIEALAKAEQGLGMAMDDLREAYSKAGQVAGLEIYKLIGLVAEAYNRTKALLQAIEADSKSAIEHVR